MLLLHTYDIKSSFMTDSIILHMIYVKLISLQLLAKHFSSFFLQSVIIAFFQSCSSFCLNDTVYKIRNGTDNLTESSFNILEGKLCAVGVCLQIKKFLFNFAFRKNNLVIFVSQTGSKSGSAFFSFVNTLLKKELNMVALTSSDFFR